MDSGRRKPSTEENAADENSGKFNRPAPGHGAERPLSAGRARNLKRRFTTPAEAFHSGSQGSISSLRYTDPNHGRDSVDVIITDITVTSSDSIDDIKALIIHLNDHLRTLRLRYCNQLSSSHLQDILGCITPKLLSFEIKESEGHNVFDLSHLEHLVTKCKHLRALHFEDCFSIDHRSARLIGTNLPDLQNISFVHTKKKLWPDNPIHELVTHLPLELHGIRFVGFDDIADFHVNYAVDCYFGSLNTISLGDCPQITDRCVEYIATNCKLLRHLELFKTNITDSTLWILAKHSTNLHYIDFSNCAKITDYGVKELVTHAVHLRYVNLSWNQKIKDLAFQAILRYCTTIVRIKLDGTSITRVPASIIRRKQTLKEVSLSMCKELTMGSEANHGDIQNGYPTSISDIFSRFYDRNLNYRLNVFVVGTSGSGKTSLIRALTAKSDSDGNIPLKEGVNVYSWLPLKDSTLGKSMKNISSMRAYLLSQIGVIDSSLDKEVTDEERSLTLQIWDCDGREVLRGVHPNFFTDSSVYVCVCNFEDSGSVELIPQLIHAIYGKMRNVRVYLVATHADKYSDEDCKNKLDMIQRAIENAESIRRKSINVELALIEELSIKGMFDSKMHELKRQLDEKYCIRKYIALSSHDGKNVGVLRKNLLVMCLDGTTFPHLVRPIPAGWNELHDEIITLREKNVLCIPYHDFEVLSTKDERVSKPRFVECVGLLHQIGVISDLRVHPAVHPDDLICLNPSLLAQCACAIHIDDQKKSFRFEAKRFWPRNQNSRPPETTILASALEDIPNKGIIKESLLPLIWQDFNLDEEQALRVRSLLLNLCLISPCKSGRSASESLALPNYPLLTPQVQYLIPLLGLLSDQKPLNWTSRPFRGDVQLSLYIYFLPVMPPGIAHRLVALVNSTLIEKCSYHYYWKHGVLTRCSDILLFVSCEQDEYLEVSARATAEDDQDTSFVELLWSETFYILDLVTEFMNTTWSNIRTTVSLIAYGDIFYMDEKIDTEPEFTLIKVYQAAKLGDDIQFKDAGDEKFLEITKLVPSPLMPGANRGFSDWIRLIARCREKLIEPERLSPSAEQNNLLNHDNNPSQSRPKKKKVSLNWSFPETEDSPVTRASNNGDSLENAMTTAQSNGHISQESKLEKPAEKPLPAKATVDTAAEPAVTSVTQIRDVDSPRVDIETGGTAAAVEPAVDSERRKSRSRSPVPERKQTLPRIRTSTGGENKPNGGGTRRSKTCCIL